MIYKMFIYMWGWIVRLLVWTFKPLNYARFLLKSRLVMDYSEFKIKNRTENYV